MPTPNYRSSQGACALCAQGRCTNKLCSYFSTYSSDGGRRRQSALDALAMQPEAEAAAALLATDLATAGQLLAGDLRSPTLWPFSAARMHGETLVIPAWEVSPEELRWEAHQEMKETGACVKYQIQMRLMQKDAQTYRERVIREILGPEATRAQNYRTTQTIPVPALASTKIGLLGAPKVAPPFVFATPTRAPKAAPIEVDRRKGRTTAASRADRAPIEKRPPFVREGKFSIGVPALEPKHVAFRRRGRRSRASIRKKASSSSSRNHRAQDPKPGFSFEATAKKVLTPNSSSGRNATTQAEQAPTPMPSSHWLTDKVARFMQFEPGSWKCPTCSVWNGAEHPKCPCCETDKPMERSSFVEQAVGNGGTTSSGIFAFGAQAAGAKAERGTSSSGVQPSFSFDRSPLSSSTGTGTTTPSMIFEFGASKWSSKDAFDLSAVTGSLPPAEMKSEIKAEKTNASVTSPPVPNPNGFYFSVPVTATASSQPTIPFTEPTAAPKKPTFTFGAPTAAIDAQKSVDVASKGPAFTFSAPAPVPTTKTTFTFGSPASEPSSSKTTFMFGESTSASSKPAISFGAPVAPTPVPAFSFGAQPSNKDSFGRSKLKPTSVHRFSFGNIPASKSTYTFGVPATGSSDPRVSISAGRRILRSATSSRNNQPLSSDNDPGIPIVSTIGAKKAAEPIAMTESNKENAVNAPPSPPAVGSVTPQPTESGQDQVKAQSCSRMLKLFCFIIGHGNAFPVSIGADASVGELQDAIVEKKRRAIDCDADELALFSTKQAEGGAWLATDNPRFSNDIKSLKAGTITETFQAMMEEDRELDPTFDISDYFDESMPSRRVIHVLVKLP